MGTIVGNPVMIGGGGAGFVISSTPPEKTNVLWIDTSVGGVLKYYDGTSWKAVKSVWG